MPPSKDQYPTATDIMKATLDRIDELEDENIRMNEMLKYYATREDLVRNETKIVELKAHIERAEGRMYKVVIPSVAAYLTILFAIFKYLA